MPNRLSIYCCIVVATTAGAQSRADSVTILPSQDTTLYESLSGSLSNGRGEYLFAGRTAQPSNSIRRAFLMFDVASSIPPGSTIDSAVLTLQMSRTPTNLDRVVSLRRINSSWGEGTSDATGEEGNGAPSTPSDATWIHQSFDTQFWNAIGGDFQATNNASASVGPVGPYSWGSTPQMVADVQSWLDDPSGNYGWVLIGDETSQGTAKRFNSRENILSGTRPSLVVGFTPIPPIPATNAWALCILLLLVTSAASILIHDHTRA